MLTLRVPSDSDLAHLRHRLEEGAVVTAAESLERYARDESTRLSAVPTAVVRPRSVEDVIAVLRWARAGPFAVIPRGAGTGVAGGALALGGGVVLCLERMDRILELDDENLTLTCEPGVTTARIHEAVEAHGLFYPPDPASLETCSIGGNVAVGAGGARAVKYGVTEDYVLGLQVVLTDGSVLELGGKNVKNATGYHLLQMMIGSEGTLGIITRIALRLLPLPALNASLLLSFPHIEAAARAVTGMLRSRVVPAVAEFMDDVTIRAAQAYLGRDLPGGKHVGAYAFIELDGPHREVLESQMLRVGEIAEAEGVIDVLAAEDRGQQARLWESRRCLGEALRALSPELGKADVVVPRARVPHLVSAAKRAGGAQGLVVACFGHAGDGNVHVNFLRQDRGDEDWRRRLAAAMEQLMRATRELGGLPSGEHGIGALKREELSRFLAPREIELMRQIKASFDPAGVLNPGKVLP